MENSEFILSCNTLHLFIGKVSNLKKYVNGGGKLWIMMGEGGDKRFGTNLNSFLENFGITMNSGKWVVESGMEFHQNIS